MMYITTNLTTYSPKNKACAEICDFIKSFEYIIVADECSLDAMIEEIRVKAAQINANNPRVRPMRIDLMKIVSQQLLIRVAREIMFSSSPITR